MDTQLVVAYRLCEDVLDGLHPRVYQQKLFGSTKEHFFLIPKNELKTTHIFFEWL